MGLRQSANEHPRAAAGIVAVLIVIAIALGIWQFNRTPSIPPKVNIGDQAFFSDDDGKSWFIDAANKIPPGTRNGKPVYRAELFRCGSAKPFVAYLARYPDEAKRRMEAEFKQGRSAPDVFEAARADMLVKAPGTNSWYSLREGTVDFVRLTKPACPDGSDPHHIMPGEKTD